MKGRIPNGSLSTPDRQLESFELPAFDGFPYLATRVVPALYHLIVLPRYFETELLRDISRRQVLAKQMFEGADDWRPLGADPMNGWPGSAAFEPGVVEPFVQKELSWWSTWRRLAVASL
jgi:hypothetical protein